MKQKVAVVTGASRGIGKATAITFAKAGYHLAICSSHSYDELTQVARQLQSFSVTCVWSQVNAGDSRQVQEFFEHIYKVYDHIDVLVNNAGISYVGLLQDMTDTDWNDILQTNLSSVFYCCRQAVPGMIHLKSGKIINISSVWGSVGASMEVAYSATKGGINALTRALAKELAPSGIQVNAIACGLIDTAMNQNLTVQDKEVLYEEIPAGRAGTAEEVARQIYDLAQSGNYLTGQVITLDGGWI